jgi:dihydrofolate reductase
MIISVIVAYSKNFAIGLDNKMLWRLSDDFKNYKKITTGHCLIMGRKTFESIGNPLPNRTSIILTRDKNYKVPTGHYVVHSLEDGIAKAKELGESECFINGGAQIYKEAMNKVNRAYITTVDCRIESADAFFPEVDFTTWNEIEGFTHSKDEKNEYSWEFKKYERT